MSLPAGHMLGPYEIIALLGAGGMGEVYRARDTRLGRDVAIKVSKEKFSERFEREARTVAALNHPNIVAIYDIGPDYIVMELVDGHSLRGQHMSTRRMLDIALQIANGLAAAHAAGVVHRDLKPENILVPKDGRAKIVDFGLAKVAPPVTGEGKTVTLHTEPGKVMGTVGYMSPEQVRGQAVDHRSDIFSFGVILYEAFSGRRAFFGDTAVETMTAILRDDLPELPDSVPPGVRQVVRHCLEKAPEDRFQSARDLAFALGTMSLPSTQTGPLAAISAPPKKRRNWARLVAAVFLIALAATAGWLMRSKPAAAVWSGTILGGSELAFDPRVSPSGNLIAFQAMDRGITQVAVMKPETANWSILTHSRDKGYAEDLAWSPDGATVYYTRFADVPLGVYSVPVLGGDERLILENAGPVEALPDGSLLVVKIGEPAGPRLYRFWPENGHLEDLNVVVPSLRPLYARASQDGKRAVVYGRPADGKTDEWTLLELDLGTHAAKPLLHSSDAPTAWTVSRDGKSALAALQMDATWRVVSIPLGSSDKGLPPVENLFTVTSHIWYMDSAPDGSIYVSLTDRPAELVRRAVNGGQEERIARIYAVRQIEIVGVLPDGRAMVTLPGSGHWRLMVIDQGKDPAPLATTNEETASPMTVLGTKEVAFMIGAAPHTAIAFADISTGRITKQISPRKGEIASLSSSPDGKTLYYSAGHVIWSQPADGGNPEMIRAGDSVVADPSGRSLIIALAESSKLRLFRRVLENGSEQEIKTDGSIPLMNFPLSPNALNAKGELLVPLNDAWFNRPGLLDTNTGRLSRIPYDDVSDYHAMAWLPDGRILALQLGARSTLWRFQASGTTGPQ